MRTFFRKTMYTIMDRTAYCKKLRVQLLNKDLKCVYFVTTSFYVLFKHQEILSLERKKKHINLPSHHEAGPVESLINRQEVMEWRRA